MNGWSGAMCLLFHAIGQKTTLFSCIIASVIDLICLLAYIFLAKALEYYEKRPEDKDGENGDWRTVEEQYVAVPLV